MAASLNKVILIGNLGRDADTKTTASGVPVASFSIATSRRVKDNATGEWREETDWNRVVLWRNEGVYKFLTKGAKLGVEGRLQTRSFENKAGEKVYATEVIADQVILLGGGGGRAAEGDGDGIVSRPRGAVGSGPAAGGGSGSSGKYEAEDDDLPF
jgi:single-strand DNA-binding protein